MASTVDEVKEYITGTLNIDIQSRYAMGATPSNSWLPDDYVFLGGLLDKSASVDYSLSRLLDGKLPSDSTDSERLLQVYTYTESDSVNDGWLSTVDPYFDDIGVTAPAGAVLGYTIQLNRTLRDIWPETQEELDEISIVLFDSDTPISTDKYEITLDGLWWISDSYDDLPLNIYLDTEVNLTLAVTKTATAEDQLNGVDTVDDSLVDPVIGTDELSLDNPNLGRDVCDAAPDVINLYSLQESEVVLVPKDRHGNTVTVDTGSVVAVFAVKESRSAPNVVNRFDCITSTETPGAFEATVLMEKPGIYFAQLMLFNADSTRLLFVTDFYVSVSSAGAISGAVSIPEMRHHVMDSCMQRNELIDGFEFSDSDIAMALQSCIEYFNGITGGATGTYSTVNFPQDGRYFLKQGAAAYLLRSKAILMSRNTFPYNAGGVSVDDQNKFREYMAIADELNKDWILYTGRRHSYNAMRKSFITVS
jgi:hypothetical protein